MAEAKKLGLYYDGYCWVYRMEDGKEAAHPLAQKAIDTAARVKKNEIAYMAPRTILRSSLQASV